MTSEHSEWEELRRLRDAAMIEISETELINNPPTPEIGQALKDIRCGQGRHVFAEEVEHSVLNNTERFVYVCQNCGLESNERPQRR